MTDVQEVYEMVTKQKPPAPGALERQHTRQVRTARNRKIGATVVAAAIGLVALIAVIPNVGDGTGTQPADDASQTTEPIRAVPATENVPIEPGRYVIGTLSPLNASHTITIDIPEGYVSFAESIVFKDGAEAGLGLWGVGWIFDDACQWRGTASPTSSTDDVVAALLGEKGLRVSTPTAATIDGYAGTYLEVTVASQAALDRCDARHFSAFALAHEGPKGRRHLESVGEPELLWILDVDGHPLVIDAFGTEQERAELEQMVASIQIEPVS
jgi:hypothetical protein